MRIRNEDGSIKCADCGQLALDGLTLCKKHLEMRRANNKKKRDKRKESGKCTECGTEDPKEGLAKCADCHKKREEVRVVRTQKRKETNCCTRCGRSKSYVKIWTNNYCAGCHFKEKFNWNGTK